MIEQDYVNGQLLLKRNDKVIKTYKFKEFVSAKQFKPVNILRNELVKVSQGTKDATQKQVDLIERKFYDSCTSVALSNPTPFDEALEIMTHAELGQLSEEILIFLLNWSTIEAVKAFGKQLAETKTKEEKPTTDSQK